MNGNEASNISDSSNLCREWGRKRIEVKKETGREGSRGTEKGREDGKEKTRNGRDGKGSGERRGM